MSLKPLNQKAFSAVEGLLIVVIVAIIGFVGYYVVHSLNQTNSNYSAANNASQAASRRLSASQTKADKAVQTVYDQYLGAIKSGKTSAQGLALVQSEVTPDLYTALTGTTGNDPFFCTTGTPTNVSTTLDSKTKHSASSVAVEADIFVKGKKTAVSVMVDSSSYKLTSVTCPAQ